jgi:hypothetical protein
LSALIMFAMGIPFVLWLRAKRRLLTHFVWLGATLIGAVGFQGLTRYTALHDQVPNALLLGAMGGFFAGVMFTRIAGTRFRTPS